MSKIISLSEPYLIGNYKKYILECLRDNWISTGGKYINKFEAKISKYLKIKYVSSVINGTSALDIALKVLGVSKDHEILVPTLTFIAPINAVIYNNASPIFFDCDEFCNIDSKNVIDFILNKTKFNGKNCINKKTKKIIKAIIIVHVFGNAANMTQLLKLCKKNKIKVIEDASESFGSRYSNGINKGKFTGTIGDIGCFSFNGNKIITAGSGGAIVSNNKKLIDKSKYLINQAKDNNFDYIHNAVGYNYRLSNVHSALGLSQLENINKILIKKKQINREYEKLFKNEKKIMIIKSPLYANNNKWLNVINFININSQKKTKLYKSLRDNNIQVRKIWKLNHLQKPYKNFQNFKINNAIKIQNDSLCLPSSPSLKNIEIKNITEIIKNIVNE